MDAAAAFAAFLNGSTMPQELGYEFDAFVHIFLQPGHFAKAIRSNGVHLGVMGTWAFWSCVLCIAGIGVLNVGVSFFCAFRVAMRSRGVRLADRQRVQLG